MRGGARGDRPRGRPGLTGSAAVRKNAGMSVRGVGVARALLVAAALVAAPGCTALDDPFGTSFTLRQPEPRVTLEGELHTDPITGGGAGCTPGGTVFWGSARNTGDVDVVDVSVTVEVFDGGGAVIGSFGASVFNGDVVDDGNGNEAYGTNLEIDQGGSFTVCTPVPFGAAARADLRFNFIVIDPVEG